MLERYFAGTMDEVETESEVWEVDWVLDLLDMYFDVWVVEEYLDDILVVCPAA